MKRILNIIFSSGDRKLDNYFTSSSGIYTFLNPVSYLDARRNKKLFREFDGILIDGNVLVRAVRILYNRKVERRSFDMTSVAPALFEFSIQNEKTIYIIGAKEEEISATINILRSNYPLLNIIGFRNGYFYGQKGKEQEYNKIVSINPDFLIVGMGIVHQEKFLLEVKNRGFKGVGFTCGGFISQTAKDEDKIDYYPQWVDKYNLRFLYRIYKEKHTRSRYFKAALIFPVLFLKDWITK